jgi:hypothetical protein
MNYYIIIVSSSNSNSSSSYYYYYYYIIGGDGGGVVVVVVVVAAALVIIIIIIIMLQLNEKCFYSSFVYIVTLDESNANKTVGRTVKSVPVFLPCLAISWYYDDIVMNST